MTLYRRLLENTISNTQKLKDAWSLGRDFIPGPPNTKQGCFLLDYDDNCVNAVDPLVCGLLTRLSVSPKI